MQTTKYRCDVAVGYWKQLKDHRLTSIIVKNKANKAGLHA